MKLNEKKEALLKELITTASTEGWLFISAPSYSSTNAL